MKARRTLLVAALASLPLVAAACGGGGGGGSSTSHKASSITVWSLEGQPDRVAATRRIADDFTKRTGIKVKIVGIADITQLPSLVTTSSAAGKLPDVMGLPLAFAHSYASQGITDSDAATAVVNKLGARTFSKSALQLVSDNGKPTAVPSDGWGQLLLYRKDLFKKAGLAPPDSYDTIMAAAQKLNRPGMAGIVIGTKPGYEFTQQSFEHVALGNNCQLVDGSGNVTLGTPQCQQAFKFYTDLSTKYSVKGIQDDDTTRATYFAGKAAMLLWSPFILDEMAGLRNDAKPTCPECKSDPKFLAKNSGLEPTIKGPAGSPAQFGEIANWAITADADKPAAERFVEFMLSDGYERWLSLSPEGKFPVRQGTSSDPHKYVNDWSGLETGVDRKAPLNSLYPKAELAVLSDALGSFKRWGLEQGQGALAGAVDGEQPVTKALGDAIFNGQDPTKADEKAQSAVVELKSSLK